MSPVLSRKRKPHEVLLVAVVFCSTVILQPSLLLFSITELQFQQRLAVSVNRGGENEGKKIVGFSSICRKLSRLLQTAFCFNTLIHCMVLVIHILFTVT